MATSSRVARRAAATTSARCAGWRVALSAACLLACAHAMPSKGVDRVHTLMEPAHPVPAAPRLKNPVAPPGLLTPQKAVLLLPAAFVGLAVAAPDLLARLLLQLICFFGSLIEPFDPLLPQTGLLRTIVTTVKSAKRAWYIKQGLPDPNDTSFMDDDDDDDDDDVDSSAKASAADDDGAGDDDDGDDGDDADEAAAADSEASG